MNERRIMYPQYLYHYGSLSSGLSRKADRTKKQRFEEILLDNKLYFASPVGFNDPFDCHYIPELTQRCVNELLKDKPLERYPEVKQEKLLHTINLQHQNHLREEEENVDSASAKLREYIRKHYGIVCFSELKDSIPMFAYYAAGHTGFCLEFATNKAMSENFFAQAKEVNYATTFPELKVEHPGTKEIVQAMLATKCKVWEHEREWRIIKAPDELPPDRKVAFPPCILTSIILGCAISKQDREFVKQLLRQRPNSINLYQAKPAANRYAIDVSTRLSY